MDDPQRLLQEIEQLRTSLEASLEENARLLESMDGQRTRLEAQSVELAELHSKLTQSKFAQDESQRLIAEQAKSDTAALQRRAETSESQEEMRVALEAMEVMAEELEHANTSLYMANRQLDERVAARTRELAEANSALRASEASFRAIADLVPDFLWRTGRTGQVVWYNRRWYQFTGIGEDETLGEGWLDSLHAVDRGPARAAWANAVSAGLPYSGEHRVKSSEGHYRWFLVRAEPVRDVRGEVAQWFGAATDVHEQRSALESLRESELRFRTLVEGMPQLVWRAKRGGRWSWASPQWTAYTGLSENASYGLGWLRALHPDDRAAAEAGWAAAGDSEPVHIEARIYCKPESRYRHFRIRANPVVADSGRLIEWLGTSTDIDDLLELHVRQDVMVAELQHRTRNLIGVVRSIALQTLRSSDSLESFQAEFEHRLAALSRVQGLLSRAEDHRITIGALIRLELEALGHPSVGDRVVIEGPEVPLRKSMVQTLALAIHELATNARKYGALSDNRGTLRIEWQLEQGTEDTAPQLFVDWTELTPPRQERATDAVRASFGRELIESALPYSLGAQTTFELSDRALHCTIRLPLTPPERDSATASPVA